MSALALTTSVQGQEKTKERFPDRKINSETPTRSYEIRNQKSAQKIF